MKIFQSTNDLAFFGSLPAFNEKLHVGKPNIGNQNYFNDLLEEIFQRSWFSNNGPLVQDFENQICKFLNVNNCIAVCNATIGLEIAIRALGLKGEVIVPSFTFIATAHALQWQEITPIFSDINPNTHNLDPECVERMITPRTTGIIGVHVWGRPCEIDRLMSIATKYRIRLMFDSAHAFGCSFKGKMIGNFGEVEVFSFHATKFFNTFEGGAIVTNDDKLAKKIRLMINFGFSGYDHVTYLGTNGKMNEISAAMGLTGLKSLDNFIQKNLSNYQLYWKELADIPGLRMIEYDLSEKNNYQYIIFEVDEIVTGISRDRIVDILHAENVLARKYFFPGCHQMEPYKSLYPNAGIYLPETIKLTQKCMALPNGTSISSDNIQEVCKIIRFCVEHGQEISQRIA